MDTCQSIPQHIQPILVLIQYCSFLHCNIYLKYFLYFIGGIKKIIGYDSILLIKNCDPRNLHCMKLLAASAARIWHAQHPFNLLPYCLYRYQRVATILYQTVTVHNMYMYHKNHSNIPLCSSSSQSSISYFSCTVLKSIKCRVTLFSKIKF